MATSILDAADMIQRTRRAQLSELAADLSAAALIDLERVDTPAIHTRPTLLRRVAALLAEHLPPGIDRIIAVSTDVPLATAVSLHSGIPFATIDSLAFDADSTITLEGELHPGEDVAIVSMTTSDRAHELREHLTHMQLRVITVISVIARPGDRDRFVYQLSDRGLQTGRE